MKLKVAGRYMVKLVKLVDSSSKLVDSFSKLVDSFSKLVDSFSKYLVNSGCLLAKAKGGGAGDQGLHRASTAQTEVGKATRATRALQCSRAVETTWTLNPTAAA